MKDAQCPVREVYFLYHDATFARSDVEAPPWLADRTPAEVWCLGFRQSLGPVGIVGSFQKSRREYPKVDWEACLYGPPPEACIVIFAMFVLLDYLAPTKLRLESFENHEVRTYIA